MDPLLKGKKILIAEDEPPMLGALTEKFTNEGCEVIPAEDGDIALKLVIEKRPDVILLDILMPKRNGTDVLEKIREMPDWGKKVPIIMLTNLSADDKIMNSIVKNEPSYYLVKTDWELAGIVEKVKDCLKHPL